MKVLIELDDDVFKDIKESNFDSARAIVRNFQATITDSIRNGTPIPDNATNGDVILAIFKEIQHYSDGKICADWWNAPYKRGDEDGSN